jgi:hypothetical protein
MSTEAYGEPVADRPVGPVGPAGAANQPVVERREVVRERTGPTLAPDTRPGWDWGAMLVRLVLTLVGAAAMIVSGFLKWINPVAQSTAQHISIRSLWSTHIRHTGPFVTSMAALVILLGLVAIVGLAPRSGWLTRLAGALGIVVAVLFSIQLFRQPQGSFPGDLGVGVWVLLGGSIVALVGGFLGTRHRVVYTSPTPTVVEE